MGWNATPTNGGGYYISPGSGSGQGGSMGLVKVICSILFVIILGAAGIWWIWIPLGLYLILRLVIWFMEWDTSPWALFKAAIWWILGMD